MTLLQLVHPDDRATTLNRAQTLRAGPGKTEFRELRLLRR